MVINSDSNGSYSYIEAPVQTRLPQFNGSPGYFEHLVGDYTIFFLSSGTVSNHKMGNGKGIIVSLLVHLQMDTDTKLPAWLNQSCLDVFVMNTFGGKTCENVLM